MAYQTITELFLQTTSKYADKYLYYAARKGHWEGLRGKDIRTTVEDLSYGLVSLGLGKGSQAAILSNNSPRWAMADYAILCMGAATVAIYPTLVSQHAAFILKNSESKAVFVEDEVQANKVFEVWDKCPDLKAVILMKGEMVIPRGVKKEGRAITTFLDLLEAGHEYGKANNLDFEAICHASKPDDLLTLIYTSGTTGEPKGVMLTHNNLVTNIVASLECINIDSNDVLLSFLPLSHSFERMAGHFLAFSRGATVYYAESLDKVAANMLVVKPTILVGAPRFYEKVYNRVIESVSQAPAIRQKIFWWALAQGRAILRHRMSGASPGKWLQKKHALAEKLVFSKLKERVGGRIRFFVSGSAPLSAEIGEFFAMMGMVVLEGYGLTETSPVITVNKLEKFKFGKVGPAIPDVEVKIAADGEILVRGPNIMKGYFKNPEDTAETIDKDGWLHTGDIGDLDEDGYLKITDRKKSILVTSGGKNVAPAPLENALVTSPYIEQVVIIGDKRNFISALIVPGFEKLQAWAAEHSVEDRRPESLVKRDDVMALIEQEVEKAMEPFARYEKVRKIALLPRELTIEKGEITPTLKVKRKVVLGNFSDIIESMYEGTVAKVNLD